MKKLMKAIAFATVMCMLLSVSAFASTAVLDENAERTLKIDVTYTGLTTEQVALLVVAKGAELASLEDSEILYIDQKAATDGTASFTAPIASTYVGDEVDVYAGHSLRDGVEELGTVKLTAEITEVKATVVANSLKTAEGIGQDETGYAFGMQVNFEKPEGYALTSVIFGVTIPDPTDATKTVRRYTEAQPIAGVDGPLQLGVSFLNGSKKNNIDPVEITNPTAIFLFEKDGAEDKVAYTNSAIDEGEKDTTK